MKNEKLSCLRVFFCSLLLLLSAVSVPAQQSKSNADALRRISTAASQMCSMQCDFVQTKHMKMLNETLTARGHMYYQQADKLRWEYTSPYQYTFIMNGQRVLLDSGRRRDVIDVNQSKIFREIARIMMSSVTGSSLSDTRDFRATVATTQKEYVATLTPQRREMKQMFQRVVLHFNRQTATITEVEIVEKKGDRTVIELRNVKKNQTVDARLFTIR